MNLLTFIENSGDSILEDYSYNFGVLKIFLEMENSDKILIKIKTNDLSFKHNYLDKSEIYRNCRAEVKELRYLLNTEKGIFIPSNNFGKFMIERRLNYHLAYGQKIDSTKYIFSLIGYEKLISCVFSSLDNITIEKKIKYKYYI